MYVCMYVICFLMMAQGMDIPLGKSSVDGKGKDEEGWVGLLCS